MSPNPSTPHTGWVSRSSKRRVVAGATEGSGVGRMAWIWAMRSPASSSCIAAGLSMVARAAVHACCASAESHSGTLRIRSKWHSSPGVLEGKCGRRARTPSSMESGTARMAAQALGASSKGAQALTQSAGSSSRALMTRTGMSRSRSRSRACFRSSERDGPVVCMSFRSNMHGTPNSRT